MNNIRAKKTKSIRKICLLVLSFSTFLIANNTIYYFDYIARVSFPNVVYSVGDSAGGSDCWGYVDREGNDYAIMGVLNGTAIVRVKDLMVVDIVAGPENGDPYYHRDMMTYGDYLYVCHEMTGTNTGIQIIDLSTLPDSIRYVGNINRDDSRGQSADRSHNLFVDMETAMLYTIRKYYNGVRILSLENPEYPRDVGVIETPDAHDVFSLNDTVFIAEGWNGTFSIWDASVSKSEPILLARVKVPASGYVHSVWTTTNGKYLMTAEETAKKTIKMWDIQELDNIELIGSYLGESNLAHNIHIKDNLAFVSHYSSGAAVIDISEPTEIKEVATYDTYASNDLSLYLGAWGIYPYSPNNYVFVSNVEGHLDILRLRKESLSTTSESNSLPMKISLAQNFPNPFNEMTYIPVSIFTDEIISLDIFNSIGVNIGTLVQGRLPNGNYTFHWDGNGMPSGVYVARLKSGDTIKTAKLLLLK